MPRGWCPGSSMANAPRCSRHSGRTAFMFRRLERRGAAESRIVTIEFEGERIAARRGDTVATALLAASVNRFRTSAVSGSERGPYCLMGTCFECLVKIDGAGNQQACLRLVRDGMRVAHQDGAVALDAPKASGGAAA